MTRHKLLMTWTLAALLSACGMQREALVTPVPRPPFDDGLVVRKSVREMDRVEGGRVVRTYRIALGENPIGPKQRQGDERTPEGFYVLDYRNPRSQFHKSLHISYPNAEDRQRAARQGVPPGGDIMLHGTGTIPLSVHRTDDRWTDGCIAVTNDEIDELWTVLPADRPVPILILP